MSRIILVMFQLLLALWKVYGSHHDIVNRYEMSLSQMTKDMFPLSWSQSWQIFDKSNSTGATIGAGIAYPSGAPEFTSVFFVGFMLLNLIFLYIVLLTIVDLLCLFSYGIYIVCPSVCGFWLLLWYL